jgi:hypothetical protein
LLTIVLTAVSISCSSGGGSEQGGNEAQITAQSGGELSAADGSFVLKVPSGAVAEDVTISFEETRFSVVDGVEDVEVNEFELKPDGLQFLKPAHVTLKLPFEDIGIDSETGASPIFDLLLVSSDGTISGLENVENEFDVAASELVLRGEISHFSKLIRTKQKLTVSLEQVVPAEVLVGTKFFPESSISEANSSLGYDLTWEAEGLQQARLDDIDSRSVASGGEVASVPVTRAASGTYRPTDWRIVNESKIENLHELTCTGVGTGLYTFRVEAEPIGTLVQGIAPRKVRVAMQGKVTCVDGPGPRATATASVRATEIAIASELPVTPTASIPSNPCEDTVSPLATPVPGECDQVLPTISVPAPTPTATATPSIGRDQETLRLIVMAASGEIARGAGDPFTGFELPSAGGDFVTFPAFTESGASGVWQFDEDDLIGTSLDPIVVSIQPPEVSNWVFVDSQPISMAPTGHSASIARYKLENDFIDSISFTDPQSGTTLNIVGEGEQAAGRDAETEFSQFYSVQMSAPNTAVYNAVADAEGIWLWIGTAEHTLLVVEGQALPGLAEGWKAAGGRSMRSAGVTPDGKMLLHISKYFTNAPGNPGETGQGLWLLSSGGETAIAQSGLPLPDASIVRTVGFPSMNSGGTISFLASANTISGVNSSIWKRSPNGELTKVVELGDEILSLGKKIENLISPIVLEDGRVMFVSQVFDETNSLINLLLIESANGPVVLASTEALPGPNGGTISAVPFAISNFSVNATGRFAFEVGFGDSIWMQSPGGHLHRVIGKGDSLDVAGANGSTTKIVTFVQYLGGASTGTGVPTGFSDAGNLGLKVTFSDGTQAVLYATFNEEPVTG